MFNSNQVNLPKNLIDDSKTSQEFEIGAKSFGKQSQTNFNFTYIQIYKAIPSDQKALGVSVRVSDITFSIY